MKREINNAIRTIIEDWIPPAIRDTSLFAALGRIAMGPKFDLQTALRYNAGIWSVDDFRNFYANMKPDQKTRGSDNSKACISRIISDIVGDSVIDVGCGTGALTVEIRDRCPSVHRVVGSDIVIMDDLCQTSGIDWIEAPCTALPFADRAFETVVCTHTLEHIVDIESAIAELRRIAARRLIVVVPRERPYKYTFNAHVHFFPYEHLLLIPFRPKTNFICERIGRDIYYREDRS